MTRGRNSSPCYILGGSVMQKIYKKMMILIFALSLLLVAGCTAKENQSKENKPKEVVAAEKKDKETKNPEQILQDFVLKNTKILHVTSISKKINEQKPDLGPFDVISGLDESGQENEIWIKDMKIHEIISINGGQTKN
jgi:hypothetical protein